MLDLIIRTALRQRALVLLVALLVAAIGTLQALRTPIDVLPDLNRPVVTVMTEAHGMVPEDVERLVTWPIEQAVNGATGVFRVRSQSGMGLSVVTVEFDWGTDIYLDRQVVSEKMQLAEGQLPEGVRPVLAPISSIMGQVQLVGFHAEGETDPVALRRLVDVRVRPRMVSLPGVAQVVVIGSQATEIEVEVDADLLRAHGVTLVEVAEAVRRSNVNVEGGVLPMGVRGPLVTVTGLVGRAEEFARAVVRDDPLRPVLVEDVARVRERGASMRTGDAGVDGRPGVILVISKQPGADTLALTERVDAELESLRAELPDDVVVRGDLFRQASFIERAIGNVLDAVRDGGILVVLILFLFLFDLRTTLITLTAIPLSIAITVLVFQVLGLTINTMTLGGLAVAIGTLVDDAIVDVENVYRRLHENAARAHPRPVLRVLFEASSEVREPVLYGTLLVTVVYLPLFFLSGIEGRLFLPIGLAYIISVVASLGVALTVTPALCYYLLGRKKAKQGEYGNALVRGLRAHADRLARFSLARTEWVLGAGLGALLVAGVLVATRGTTFLPAFNEGAAQVSLYLPPDTSLETSHAVGQQLEEVLGSVEGVDGVARRTGRAEGDEHAMPVSVNEAILRFDPDSERTREEILEDIRHRVKDSFPGIPAETEQPLAHLLSHMLSGVTAQVAIKISGPDLGTLRQVARRVEGAVAEVEGVRDLFTEPQVLIEQVSVEPRREELARQGLTVEELAHTVELALGSEEVSQLREGTIAFPVRVRLRPGDRADLAALEDLPLLRDDGTRVRLGDVATVALTRTPNNIQRENVQRRIVVQHNVGGRSLGEVVGDVELALAPVRRELAQLEGYRLEVAGQFQAQQEATRVILSLSALSVVLMVLILHLHFRSTRLALLVLGTRPMALVGGMVLVSLTGQVLSVATMVGFIALLGMSARNAILLVDHAVHLTHEGGGLTPDVIRRAARERIVPVLMTALTSGIGLLPLALSAEEPGRELLYPVATVILGGLVTGTLLDFVLMPGLLWHTARGALLQAAEASEPAHDPLANPAPGDSAGTGPGQNALPARI